MASEPNTYKPAADASLAHTGASGDGTLALAAGGLLAVGISAVGAARYTRRSTGSDEQPDPQG
ncbi:hypothetical protein [Streptomyces zinciresistens]|uniref:hypothetical protein n=1 Tax=Streptomyces zinciresistens TaxID=1073330 RepID=UPI0002FCC5EA|nr:hypothetical protein [Streptomyces zinciresistens]